jgi:hypothetical protein
VADSRQPLLAIVIRPSPTTRVMRFSNDPGFIIIPLREFADSLRAELMIHRPHGHTSWRDLNDPELCIESSGGKLVKIFRF